MVDMENGIKEIVASINDYINGNDMEENYEVILNVVDGLREYIKLTKKNKLRATFVFLVSKLATFITSPLLMKEDLYREIMSSCRMDYKFYLEAVERLKRYKNDIAFQINIENNGKCEKEEVKKLLMITDSAIEELKKE